MVPSRARFLTAVALVAVLGGCSEKDKFPANSIEIGIDLPLSGADSSVGRSTYDGMMLAIKQANEGGLSAGLKLAPVTLDDTVNGLHDARLGAQNARNFAGDPNVVAMLGPYNSNVAEAQIPITNAAGLAQISPAAVGDDLTVGESAQKLRAAKPEQNNFFRVCATNAAQGAAAAEEAIRLGDQSAYVVDDGETYGRNLADTFAVRFQSAGGSIAGRERIKNDEPSIRALLKRIAGKSPSAIFYGGTTATGGGRLRDLMIEEGMEKTAFIGGDGIADLANVAGKRADGAYYTLATANLAALPSAQAFLEAYRKTYHRPPGPYSANGYAAALVAIAAIEAGIKENGGRAPGRATVLANVAKTDALATPIGPVSFDAAGDLKEPAVSVYQFRDGASVFVERVVVKGNPALGANPGQR